MAQYGQVQYGFGGGEEDTFAKLTRAFQIGMQIRQQREASEARALGLQRDAQRLKMEQELNQLAVKLKLDDLFRSMPRSAVAGKSIDIPTLESLGLPGMSLPAQSREDVSDAAVKTAGRKSLAESLGKTEGEKIPMNPLLQAALGKRTGELGINAGAGESMSPDVLRAITTMLGQFPENLTMQGDIPGIARKGEVMSTPEATLRGKSMEERGAQSRSDRNANLRAQELAIKERGTFDPNSNIAKAALQRFADDVQRGDRSSKEVITALGRGSGQYLLNELEGRGALELPKEARTTLADMTQVETLVGQYEKLFKEAHAEESETKKQLKLEALQRFMGATATRLPEAFGDKGRKSDQDVARAMKALPTRVTGQSLDAGIYQLGLIKDQLNASRDALVDEYTSGYNKGGERKKVGAGPAGAATRKQFKNTRTGALEWFTLKNGQWAKE